MNYYQYHIGDFNNGTRHLTLVERALYRDLIDLYYDTELPITLDVKYLQKRLLARSDDEKEALSSVLDEFFTLEDDGYHNSRCNSEIEKYQGNQQAKSRAGKASAAKRQQKSTSVETESNSSSTPVHNQEPVTSNQEPIDKGEKSLSRKTQIPKDFKISDEVKTWAEKNNHQNLEQHLENFVLTCESKPYKYTNWDSAFKRAIRDNWAKIQTQDRDVRLWHETEAGVLAKASELRITQGTDEPVGILKQRVAAKMGIEL